MLLDIVVLGIVGVVIIYLLNSGFFKFGLAPPSGSTGTGTGASGLGYTPGGVIFTSQWQKTNRFETGLNEAQGCLDGSKGVYLQANGDGTATTGGKSPRVTAKGNFQDTESTIFVYNTGKGNMDMRPKTEHYCGNPPDKFGGYIIDFSFDDNNVDCRKEETHKKGYSSRINKKSFKFPTNTWVGCRAVCYNVSDGVKLEGYVSVDGGKTWKLVTETTDTGNMKGKPYTKSASQSSIRFNISGEHTSKKTDEMKLKDWVIRNVGSSVSTSVRGAKLALAMAYYSSLHYPYHNMLRFSLSS